MSSVQQGNKYFAALIIALLISLITTIVAETLVDPIELDKAVYHIEVKESAPSADQADQKPKEIEPLTPLLESADIEKGKSLSKQCSQCHTFVKNGAHRIGPNLFGIVGMKIASKPGYAYSKGALKLKEQDYKWDVESLNKFLLKPRQFMPGTKMSYAGLKRASQRAHIVKYLQSLG